MKAFPIIIGLGAVVLLSSKSSATSTKKESVKYVIGKITPKKNTANDCNSNEYLNADSYCQVFWNEKTPALVKTELDKQLNAYKDQSYDNLCQQKDYGDGLINPNYQKIISNIIIKLWPMISASSLPPTIKSPVWMVDIWKKVVSIYSEQVCGISSLPPIT